MKEIGDWLDEIYLKFDAQENNDPRRSANEFLQRYVFCDVYEILFGSPHRVAPVVIQVDREKDKHLRRSVSFLDPCKN